MYKKFKKQAFTLAETLIVLAVIGVVAAIALPSLNDHYNEAQYIAKARKIYAELDIADSSAIEKYGPRSSWLKDIAPVDWGKVQRDYITEFLDVERICTNQLGCFSNGPMYDSAGVKLYDNYYNSLPSKFFVVLKSGTALCFERSKIRIDLDSVKGPNKYGVDLFSLSFTDRGLVFEEQGVPALANSFHPDYDELKWVLDIGNMDYLRCANQLNWASKISCK